MYTEATHAARRAVPSRFNSFTNALIGITTDDLFRRDHHTHAQNYYREIKSNKIRMNVQMSITRKVMDASDWGKIQVCDAVVFCKLLRIGDALRFFSISLFSFFLLSRYLRSLTNCIAVF